MVYQEPSVLLMCLVHLCYGTGTTHLSYYETLSYVHVSTKVKRSSPTDAKLIKKLHFTAFQRTFHLTLKAGSSVIPPNFRARLVHRDGTSTFFPIDQSKIFSGHVRNNANTQVIARLENSLWHINIMESTEAFAVEPAWRILSPLENPFNDTMVAYRLSDLKGFDHGLRPRFCNARKGYLPPNYRNESRAVNQSTVLYYKPHTQPKERETRSKVKKNTCMAYIVGDYSFLRSRCQSDHNACSSLLIFYIHMLDDIYRKSHFESHRGRTYTGIGVQISELVLYAEYSKESPGMQPRHFNGEYVGWSADSKLASFASHMCRAKKHYCLNHLLTEFADPTGVLGLAYVNQLCHSHGVKEAYNSGITTGTNKVGILIPSLTQNLVFTHEVGHSFGANHDPDTNECAPEDAEGGKFVMWEYAVSGSLPNNHKYSKCSLRQIGRGVPFSCFQARYAMTTFCGNGMIDPGEECDEGYKDRVVNNCCTDNCTLRPGAVCSEVNHECCRDCEIADNETICNAVLHLQSCQKTSYCSGVSLFCPSGEFLEDGANCGEELICRGGECIGLCAQHSNDSIKLKPCQCKPNTTEACMWCCYDATDEDNPGKCQPILPTPRLDGTICFKGTCSNGICRGGFRGWAETRLSAYIKFVKVSSFRQFMKSNIVMVVIILSLLFWVPPSLWIHRQDMAEQRKRDEMMDQLISSSGSVTKDMDGIVDEDFTFLHTETPKWVTGTSIISTNSDKSQKAKSVKFSTSTINTTLEPNSPKPSLERKQDEVSQQRQARQRHSIMKFSVRDSDTYE